MTKVNKAPQTCQRPGRLCTRGSPEDEKVMYNPKSKPLTALTSLRDFQGTFRGCPHRVAVAGGTATEVWCEVVNSPLLQGLELAKTYIQQRQFSKLTKKNNNKNQDWYHAY